MKIKFGNEEMSYGAKPELFAFAKQLRNAETGGEQILWHRLHKNQVLGLKFRRQHPIKYFIADFYCHKIKLVIEVDGGIHKLRHQWEYDKGRDYEVKELGLTVLRVTDEDVLKNTDAVISQIEKLCSNKLKSVSQK